VPKVGDTVQLEGGQLTVLEMDNHRITLLKFEDTALARTGRSSGRKLFSRSDPAHTDLEAA
jgi:hypothetical protein